VQEAAVGLEAGEFELGGHPVQTLDTVAPATTEYVPATQSEHAALPVAILYFPAAHALHVPPLGPL